MYIRAIKIRVTAMGVTSVALFLYKEKGVFGRKIA